MCKILGFKWLGNKALDLKARGFDVLFLYEEALGFCVGNGVVDKDGISAACVLIELYYELMHKSGITSKNSTQMQGLVARHLGELYSQYGEFVSYNSYVISHDPVVTDRIFQRLRTSQGSRFPGYWSECCGVEITAIKDITKGYDSASRGEGDSDVLPSTPESHMIMYEFANGCSVTLRTSGTEPKIKFYTEMAGEKGKSRSEVESYLHTFINNLVQEMLQPTENGLTCV